MFTLILFICNVILLVCVLKSIKADKARQAEEEAKARKNKELRRKNLEFFIPKVRSAKSLRDLFTLHIQIWASGIQHSNFGPNQYGIFRTQDILKMRPEEVFLGNIYGLFTHPMPFWEETTDENSKQIVTSQYRSLLLSNLEYMLQTA